MGNWTLFDFLEFAILLEPVADTCDGENTCQLHNPPDKNLHGKKRVANHRTDEGSNKYEL